MKAWLVSLLLVAGCGGAGAPAETPPDFATEDPADAIVNGATKSAATTYWGTSNGGDVIAPFFSLFADHTGVGQEYGSAIAITWQKLSRANIAITGIGSVPSITEISGSVSAGTFSGNVAGSVESFSIVGGSL